MRLPLALLALLALAPARAEPLAVAVSNASEPVACAEKDNVTLNLAHPRLTRFRVEARHPAYAGTIREDRTAPDWAECGALTEASSRTPVGRNDVLHDGPDLRLVAYTHEGFWRPNATTVRVGDRAVPAPSLLQLFVRRPDGADGPAGPVPGEAGGGSGAGGRPPEGRFEEVLVLYPADGYWRIRPFTPPHLLPGASAYGSSVLIGPVAVDERPVVAIDEVRFDPQSLTFTLAFSGGGGATVRLAALDRDRLALDVALDRPVTERPFAALRSMFVTEGNADVARVAVRPQGHAGWQESPVMGFEGVPEALALWTGRTVPSRHNTSAPDLVFRDFAAPLPP